MAERVSQPAIQRRPLVAAPRLGALHSLSRGGWRAQLGLYLAAYLVYSLARWLASGDIVSAREHARWIAHVEGSAHLNVEASVQRWLDTGAPIWVLNHLYLAAQFVVVPGALIFLYRSARPLYRHLRNTVVATWLIAVPVYACFPVAPPRLAGLGISDTVSHQSLLPLNSPLATAFYNPLAAVPSLHAGFAFAVGVACAAAARTAWVRALAALWGPLVSLAVVATGNHFVLDVGAGLLATTAGFAADLALGRLAKRHPRSGRRLARSLARAGACAPTCQRHRGELALLLPSSSAPAPACACAGGERP